MKTLDGLSPAYSSTPGRNAFFIWHNPQNYFALCISEQCVGSSVCRKLTTAQSP